MRFLLLASTCVWIAACAAPAPSTQPRTAHEQAPESPSPANVDPTRERTLIDESEVARKATDYATARTKAAEAVTSLLAWPEVEQDPAWIALLDSAGGAASNAQDTRTANAAWQRVLDVRSRRLPEDDLQVQKARINLAATMNSLGDLAGAQALEERALEVLERTLPDEDPDLQKARTSLAWTLKSLGDSRRSRALYEKVLDVDTHTLSEDDPELQRACLNLAASMYGVGDLAAARPLEAQALEVLSRTLPDDHPDLQRARMLLGSTIQGLGDTRGAKPLFDKVLEVDERTLPEDHPALQEARIHEALVIYQLGDLRGARALLEKALEVDERTLPENHPDLQSARLCLALVIKTIGDLQGSRVLLEKVLEVDTRTLPEDHHDLQIARLNLAETIELLGDLPRALALKTKALDVLSRTLSDDDLDLQGARLSVGLTLQELGDLAGARALQDKVLDVLSRTLSDDHPDLQFARMDLAATLLLSGDLQGARNLHETVLEIRSRSLPDDHPDLQLTRQDLAATLELLGEGQAACELLEKVLEVDSRTLPEDHPFVRQARQNLAAARRNLAVARGSDSEVGSARAEIERAVATGTLALPDDHPDLQTLRGNLALILADEVVRTRRDLRNDGESAEKTVADARRTCVEVLGAVTRAETHAAWLASMTGSSREAEARCANAALKLDLVLSFASGYGVFEPLRELESDSFVLSESTRGAAIASAELTRRAVHAPEYPKLRTALRTASEELASLVRTSTTSDAFDRARMQRETVERELVTLATTLLGGKSSGAALDVESLSSRLDPRQAAVAFRRFTKSSLQDSGKGESKDRQVAHAIAADHLCAFVVRSAKVDAKPAASSMLTIVDLGPVAPIEEAVHAWRDGLGIGSAGRGVPVAAREESKEGGRARGVALREKVFDPILPALGGAERVVVVLEDVLHLVPLEALPADEKGSGLVGERWRIETRATLSELVAEPAKIEGDGSLLGVGGVDYDEGSQAVALASSALPPRAGTASILRGGAWSNGFSALSATRGEVESIEKSFVDAFGPSSERHVLERAEPSKEKLLELAPRARFVHVATHGWFAPESIKSWEDPEPLDKKSGITMRKSGREQVKGMSPMLLCGLALAGANLPENAIGRVPGLITAEELSTLDLSNCELAVLSACDTNVGERRAGQGVHSLQMALQMAGARSVITSLWKVPDEATKDLMLDFYRCLWVEKKPKWQALWEAKMKIRNEKDESGKPKYSTRDWAAWVLTGDPN